MREEVNKLTQNIGLSFKEILEYEFFSLGKYSLSLYELLAFFIILIIGFGVSKLLKKIIYKSDKLDISKKFAFSKILHYCVAIVTFFLGIRSLGIDISPILLGSGAILVGVGIGLQNLFLDFVSGVIILIDRTVKVGDVVDVDGIIGKVEEVKMRTTKILTRDNKNIIFPNSTLTKDKLINFSHDNDVVVFEINVGVHYNTNIEKASILMIEAAIEQEEVLKEERYKPIVRLENFGESSLDLKMLYQSKNLFRQPMIRSEIRKAILEKFRKNEINIPYPIRTVEFPKTV